MSGSVAKFGKLMVHLDDESDESRARAVHLTLPPLSEMFKPRDRRAIIATMAATDPPDGQPSRVRKSQFTGAPTRGRSWESRLTRNRAQEKQKAQLAAATANRQKRARRK